MGCPSDPSQSIGHFKYTKGPHGSVRFGGFLQHEFKKKYFEFYVSFQTIKLNVYCNFYGFRRIADIATLFIEFINLHYLLWFHIPSIGMPQ